jgi:hypothetical protein
MSEVQRRQPPDHCQRCGNALADDATATMVWDNVFWRVYGAAEVGLSAYQSVPVCEACATPDESAKHRVEQVCAGCSRPLRIPAACIHDAVWTHCSERCYRRAARAKGRFKSLTCETCRQPFQSARQDARYCTPACRQWAHRRRHA